jgi:hypothetical protein
MYPNYVSPLIYCIVQVILNSPLDIWNNSLKGEVTDFRATTGLRNREERGHNPFHKWHPNPLLPFRGIETRSCLAASVLFIRIESFSAEYVLSSPVTVRTKTVTSRMFVSVFPGAPTTWIKMKLKSYNDRHTEAWHCL